MTSTSHQSLPDSLQAPRSRRPLILLLAADGVSQTGNMMTMLAVPWFVLETTGSAARTGLTASVQAVAVVLAGFLGGALVDRLGHKRTSIISDLASAVTVALIPLLHLTIGLAFWQLLALVFCGAILDTPGWAARKSLLEVTSRIGGVGLDRTNGTAMIVNRAAGLAGPLLAGVLIAALGATTVLWLDAASFLVSAGLIALGIPRRISSASERNERAAAAAKPGKQSYLAESLEGLRFIRTDRVIFWLLVGAALGSLLAEPVYTVIMPVYAREVYGSSVDLGTIWAALAIGSIGGNLAFLAWAPRLPRRATIIVGFAVRALAFWVLVPTPSLPIVLLAIAIESLFLEPTNPMWMTIFQERVPEELRGRVFGAFIALLYTTRSLGLLGYGIALEQFGLSETLVILAAVNLVVPVVFLFLPALREIEPTRSSQQPAHQLA